MSFQRYIKKCNIFIAEFRSSISVHHDLIKGNSIGKHHKASNLLQTFVTQRVQGELPLKNLT